MAQLARGTPPSTGPRVLGRMAPRSEVIHVAWREVTVTNPDKVFPTQSGGDGGPGSARAGHNAVADAPVTKLELVRYYPAVADVALRGAGGGVAPPARGPGSAWQPGAPPGELTRPTRG